MNLPLLLLVLTASPTPETYRDDAPGTPSGWTRPKAMLGKALFNDKRLSRDGTISCATCHDPTRAFTDGRVASPGVDGKKGRRNTPTLVNRALGPLHFWDGRALSLEQQASTPISSNEEMGLPLSMALARLRADPRYREEFQAAFKGPPTAERLAEALAHYERTLFSVDSPFDRYLAGDTKALGPAALKGLQLFGGKAHCGDCHSGIHFSDESFHVLGVGGPDEPGRAAVTGSSEDRGAFKTPTLREVARTAPYMHDGSLATLADVVDYYDRGGTPHPGLSKNLRKLRLTREEKANLVAFLESLSGHIVDVDTSPSARVAP